MRGLEHHKGGSHDHEGRVAVVERGARRRHAEELPRELCMSGRVILISRFEAADPRQGQSDATALYSTRLHSEERGEEICFIFTEKRINAPKCVTRLVSYRRGTRIRWKKGGTPKNQGSTCDRIMAEI